MRNSNLQIRNSVTAGNTVARESRGNGMGISRANEGNTIQQQGGRTMRCVGQVLPREKFTPKDVAEGQARVLLSVFGEVESSGRKMKVASPAKEQARVTGQSERSARNQQAALCCMQLTEFFNNCWDIPELAQWGVEMMGAIQRNDIQRVGELMEGHRAITLRIDVNGASVETKVEGE